MYHPLQKTLISKCGRTMAIPCSFSSEKCLWNSHKIQMVMYEQRSVHNYIYYAASMCVCFLEYIFFLPSKDQPSKMDKIKIEELKTIFEIWFSVSFCNKPDLSIPWTAATYSLFWRCFDCGHISMINGLMDALLQIFEWCERSRDSLYSMPKSIFMLSFYLTEKPRAKIFIRMSVQHSEFMSANPFRSWTCVVSNELKANCSLWAFWMNKKR